MKTAVTVLGSEVARIIRTIEISPHDAYMIAYVVDRGCWNRDGSSDYFAEGLMPSLERVDIVDDDVLHRDLPNSTVTRALQVCFGRQNLQVCVRNSMSA